MKKASTSEFPRLGKIFRNKKNGKLYEVIGCCTHPIYMYQQIDGKAQPWNHERLEIVIGSIQEREYFEEATAANKIAEAVKELIERQIDFATIDDNALEIYVCDYEHIPLRIQETAKTIVMIKSLKDRYGDNRIFFKCVFDK